MTVLCLPVATVTEGEAIVTSGQPDRIYRCPIFMVM
jgi:hypothetical protein